MNRQLLAAPGALEFNHFAGHMTPVGSDWFNQWILGRFGDRKRHDGIGSAFLDTAEGDGA